MSTEYRRGIPSAAHVEAATRLGLLWEESVEADRWRLEIRNGALFSDFAAADEGFTNWDRDLSRDRYSLDGYSLRPIRPDGTPVDWEVLDQEVAGVGQQGLAQSFRADLWRRICRHFISADEDRVSSRHLSDVETIERRGCLFRDGDGWQWLEDGGPTRADILARWTVYQELKPLYDIVDGARGEVAIPRDVEAEWDIPRSSQPNEEDTTGDWLLHRGPRGLSVFRPDDPFRDDATLVRNFAAVLDAVAERRVAERMRGQTQAPTVTSAQPEPRRFADVRPDRHGWRWWRIYGHGEEGTRIECRNDNHFRWHARQTTDWLEWHLPRGGIWLDRTVIPTDEQGNPVSWESIGQAQAQVDLGQPISQPEGAPAPAFSVLRSRHVARLPTQASVAAVVGESARQVYRAEVAAQIQPGQVIAGPAGIEQVSPAQSRFALIELDDADPTAERIRQEQVAERQRLAELRQRLVAERVQQPTPTAPTNTSRFDLIEPDPQADPAASIRAWEARQAAAKVRPVAAPSRIVKPAAAPRRPTIEVVDAEVDGLSRSDIVAALVGRAFNGGC